MFCVPVHSQGSRVDAIEGIYFLLIYLFHFHYNYSESEQNYTYIFYHFPFF